jgi:hypothetical protein
MVAIQSAKPSARTLLSRSRRKPALTIPEREAREQLNAWRAAQSRTGTHTMILVGK